MTSSPVPRTAVVTGGNRGLGRSTVLALARDGVDVVLTYRSHHSEAAAVVAEAAALGAHAAALQLDTAEPTTFPAFADELRTTLAAWGRSTVDLLVNNAGHATITRLGATTAADLDGLYAVHFRAPFLLTQELAPVLADGGAVVNLSSGLARFAGDGWSAYGSMKAAVEQLTRYWAKELGVRGIRVNAVAPGPIGTDFGGGTVRDNDAIRQAMAGQAALGRVGEPDDIGPLVAALLTDSMRWVTGQRIEASGGTLL